MRTLAYLMAVVLMGTALWAYGQEGDQKDSLQRRLNSQFPLTQVTYDKSDIVTAGAVLQMQKDGLMMYSIASPMAPVNTYKNGKISQGGSGFGRDLLITMAAPGNGTASSYPHRRFVANEALWVTRIDVQNGGVVFHLYSDPYDGIRYYGELKVAFDKGTVPSTDQAMTRIAEVLTARQDDNARGNASVAQAPVRQADAPVPPVVELKLPSVYVSSQTSADQLQLNTDKSFSLQEGGQHYHGTFNQNGDSLELNINETNTTAIAVLHGDSLTDKSTGLAWARQGSAPEAVMQLKLPSVYVSTQTPADQLQLNTDKSFSLQEGGQRYHGTFNQNGDRLELNINETNTATTVILQGNGLTDSSGHTWTLRDRMTQNVPNGAVLYNQDVIKMAKAGLKDATILAKIRSSKCQFDTSTDALIHLKQSGISDAVMEAMLSTGK